MQTVGIYLIYAAVVVRGLVRLELMAHPGLVVALLALYGLLLVVQTWWLPARPAAPGPVEWSTGRTLQPPWLLPLCLLAQSGLVIGLLLSRAVQDSFALLFIPPSLQAVLAFGRRVGFVWIAAFALAMAGPLIVSQEGWQFGVVMVANYSGVCFLCGGYAHQVRVAEIARRQNRRAFEELQHAHRQLQGNAAQRQDLMVERERSRLARELHDSVTQTVFSMNLTVQSARLLLGRDKAQVAAQIERLEELAAGAMAEIQALVSQLGHRPGARLAGEGLPAALHRLAGERRVRDGLDVTLKVRGEQTLLEPVEAGLYCIAQEALTNVAKHAGTQQAILRLHLGEGASFLEVEDRGLGFDPQAAWGQRGHLGLAGMADRAREFGWILSIESRPGCGTRIRVAEGTGGSEG